MKIYPPDLNGYALRLLGVLIAFTLGVPIWKAFIQMLGG